MTNIFYTEPSDYIPEEIRKEFKVGEYYEEDETQEDTVEEDNPENAE